MSITRRTANKLVIATAALGRVPVSRSQASQSMSPEVMFIQSQNLPWSPAIDWDSGALQRTVRVWPDGNPHTYILKLAPEFIGTIPPNKSGKFYVVSGRVNLNGQIIEHQALVKFGQGKTRGSIISTDGASLIVFEERRQPSSSRDENSQSAFEIITPWLINWSHRKDFDWPLSSKFVEAGVKQPGHPDIPIVVRTFWKPLDFVSAVSDRTMLWAGLPAQTDPDQRCFQPTCDVELFVLQGDIVDSQVGTMIQGAYAKLSKGNAYGPWSTANGFVALIKAEETPGMLRLSEGKAETDPWHFEQERIPPHLQPFSEAIEPPNWWTLPTASLQGGKS